MKKLTNNIIDERLISTNRNIERVGNYVNNLTNIDWKCLICKNIWSAKPSNILFGKNCVCRSKYSPKKISHNRFIEKVRLIHGDEFEYLEEYNGAHQPINIKHKKCETIFKMRPNDHIRQKQGCPVCKESKSEKQIRKIFQKLNLKFKSQYWFKDCRGKKGWPLKFDFCVFDDDKNIIFLLEYDGRQHFEIVDFSSKTNKQLLETNFELNLINDKIKNDYCKFNNLKLLRIPYWNYNNIESIIHTFLFK